MVWDSLVLGTGMKSSEPVSDCCSEPWVHPGVLQCPASCVRSVQEVSGWWRHWCHWHHTEASKATKWHHRLSRSSLMLWSRSLSTPFTISPCPYIQTPFHLKFDFHWDFESSPQWVDYFSIDPRHIILFSMNNMMNINLEYFIQRDPVLFLVFLSVYLSSEDALIDLPKEMHDNMKCVRLWKLRQHIL